MSHTRLITDEGPTVNTKDPETHDHRTGHDTDPYARILRQGSHQVREPKPRLALTGRRLVVTGPTASHRMQASDAATLGERLTAQGAQTRVVLMDRNRPRGAREFQLIRELQQTVTSFAPEAVLVCVPPSVGGAIAVSVVRWLQTPCVVLVNGLSSVMVASGGGVPWQRLGTARVLELLERAAFRDSTHVAVPSSQFIPTLRRLAPATPVTVIAHPMPDAPTGTDTSTRTESCRARTRHQLGWEGRFVVARVGDLGYRDGLEDLVLALHHVAVAQPEVLVSFLGGGSRKRALAEATEGLRSVELRDPVSPSRQLDVMRAADVLLVHERDTSLELSQPTELASLFPAGRPVLAVTPRDSTTASELARSGAGLIVTPHDARAFATTIARLREDESERTARGSAALRQARRSWKQESDDPLARLLERLLQNEDNKRTADGGAER